MTKAERIYRDTKLACRQYIEAWGYEEGIGFNSMETEEVIYTRTENAIKKLIKHDAWIIKNALKCGVIEQDEKTTLKINTLKMVNKTLENTYIA